MTAAFATLAFLSVLWMLVVVAATVFEQSGAKIRAALAGRSVAMRGSTIPVRVRQQRYQSQRPMRASARLRAAA